MKYLVSLLLAALLLAGGYYLSQTEEIASLLEPPSERTKDPLAFLEEGPPVIPPDEPEKPRRTPRRRASSSGAVAAEPAAVPGPAVPNNDVASALLGILRARGLAYGVSLSVTDDKVEVVGTVDSADKRRRILDVIEKGRGRRKLVADQLTVERE